MRIPSGLFCIEPASVRTLPLATNVGCGPGTVDGHGIQVGSQGQESTTERAIASISIHRTGPTGQIDLST